MYNLKLTAKIDYFATSKVLVVLTDLTQDQ